MTVRARAMSLRVRRRRTIGHARGFVVPAFAAVLLTIASLLATPSVRAQTTDAANALTEHQEIVGSSLPWYARLVIPRPIALAYEMRDYARSNEFGELTRALTPQRSMDELYLEAFARAHGEKTEALFATAFASFEHEFIPLSILGARIDVPLTSETHEQFVLRVSHLPRHLYGTPEDDRDKLQHFFSSAWLKSALGMDWLASLGGEFVEAGESAAVVGGVRDPRDIHANHDGIRFAAEPAIRESAVRDRLSARAEDACSPWLLSPTLPSSALTPNP